MEPILIDAQTTRRIKIKKFASRTQHEPKINEDHMMSLSTSEHTLSEKRTKPIQSLSKPQHNSPNSESETWINTTISTTHISTHAPRSEPKTTLLGVNIRPNVAHMSKKSAYQLKLNRWSYNFLPQKETIKPWLDSHLVSEVYGSVTKKKAKMPALRSEIISKSSTFKLQGETKTYHSSILTTKFSRSRLKSETRKSAFKKQLKKQEILKIKNAKQFARETRPEEKAINLKSRTMQKVSITEKKITALIRKSKLDIERKARSRLSKCPEKRKTYPVKMPLKPKDASSKWRIKPKYTSKNEKKISCRTSKMLHKNNCYEKRSNRLKVKTKTSLSQLCSRRQKFDTMHTPDKNPFMKFLFKQHIRRYSYVHLSSKCITIRKPLSGTPIGTNLQKFKSSMQINRSIAIAQIKPRASETNSVLKKSHSHTLIKSRPDGPDLPKQPKKLDAEYYVTTSRRTEPKRSVSEKEIVTPNSVSKYLPQPKNNSAPNVPEDETSRQWRIASSNSDSTEHRKQMPGSSKKSSSKQHISESAKQPDEAKPLESNAAAKEEESPRKSPNRPGPGQSQTPTDKPNQGRSRHLANADKMPTASQAPIIQPADRETKPDPNGQNDPRNDDPKPRPTSSENWLKNRGSTSGATKDTPDKSNNDDSDSKPTRLGTLSGKRSYADVATTNSNRSIDDNSNPKSSTVSAILSEKRSCANVIGITAKIQTIPGPCTAESRVTPEPTDAKIERRKSKERPPVKPKPDISKYIALLGKEDPIPDSSRVPVQPAQKKPPDKEATTEILTQPVSIEVIVQYEPKKGDPKPKPTNSRVLSTKRSCADVIKVTSQDQIQPIGPCVETRLNMETAETRIENRSCKKRPPVRPKPNRSLYIAQLRKECQMPCGSQPPTQPAEKETINKPLDHKTVPVIQTESSPLEPKVQSQLEMNDAKPKLKKSGILSVKRNCIDMVKYILNLHNKDDCAANPANSAVLSKKRSCASIAKSTSQTQIRSIGPFVEEHLKQEPIDRKIESKKCKERPPVPPKPNRPKYVAQLQKECQVPYGSHPPIQPAPMETKTEPPANNGIPRIQIKSRPLEAKVQSQPQVYDATDMPKTSEILSSKRSCTGAVKGTSQAHHIQPRGPCGESRLEPEPAGTRTERRGSNERPTVQPKPKCTARLGNENPMPGGSCAPPIRPAQKDRKTEPPCRKAITRIQAKSSSLGLNVQSEPKKDDSKPRPTNSENWSNNRGNVDKIKETIGPPKKDEPQLKPTSSPPRRNALIAKDVVPVAQPAPSGVLTSKRSNADVVKDTSHAPIQPIGSALVAALKSEAKIEPSKSRERPGVDPKRERSIYTTLLGKAPASPSVAQVPVLPSKTEAKIERKKSTEQPPVKPNPDKSKYASLLGKEGPKPSVTQVPVQPSRQEAKIVPPDQKPRTTASPKFENQPRNDASTHKPTASAIISKKTDKADDAKPTPSKSKPVAEQQRPSTKENPRDKPVTTKPKQAETNKIKTDANAPPASPAIKVIEVSATTVVPKHFPQHPPLKPPVQVSETKLFPTNYKNKSKRDNKRRRSLTGESTSKQKPSETDVKRNASEQVKPTPTLSQSIPQTKSVSKTELGREKSVSKTPVERERSGSVMKVRDQVSVSAAKIAEAKSISKTETRRKESGSKTRVDGRGKASSKEKVLERKSSPKGKAHPEKSISKVDVKPEKSISRVDVKPEKSISKVYVKPEKSISKVDVKPEKSISKVDVKPEKSISKVDVKPEKSISKVDVKPEKSLSRVYVKPEKSISKAEVQDKILVSRTSVSPKKSVSRTEVDNKKPESKTNIRRKKSTTKELDEVPTSKTASKPSTSKPGKPLTSELSVSRRYEKAGISEAKSQTAMGKPASEKQSKQTGAAGSKSAHGRQPTPAKSLSGMPLGIGRTPSSIRQTVGKISSMLDRLRRRKSRSRTNRSGSRISRSQRSFVDIKIAQSIPNTGEPSPSGSVLERDTSYGSRRNSSLGSTSSAEERSRTRRRRRRSRRSRSRTRRRRSRRSRSKTRRRSRRSRSRTRRSRSRRSRSRPRRSRSRRSRSRPRRSRSRRSRSRPRRSRSRRSRSRPRRSRSRRSRSRPRRSRSRRSRPRPRRSRSRRSRSRSRIRKRGRPRSRVGMRSGRSRSRTQMKGRGKSRSRLQMRGRGKSRSRLQMRGRGKSRSRIQMRGRGKSRSRIQMRGRRKSRSRIQMRGRGRSRSRLQMRGRGKSRSRIQMRGRGKSRSRLQMRGRGRSRSQVRMRGRGRSRSRLQMRSRGRSRSRAQMRGRSRSRVRMRGRGRSRSRVRMRGRGRSRSGRQASRRLASSFRTRGKRRTRSRVRRGGPSRSRTQARRGSRLPRSQSRFRGRTRASPSRSQQRQSRQPVAISRSSLGIADLRRSSRRR